MENLNFYNLKEDSVLEDKEIIENLETLLKKKLIQNIFMMKRIKTFEKITHLDDYYPTRSELEILEKKTFLKKIFLKVRQLLNLEVGLTKKSKKLLEALNNPKEYIPIDISYEFLKFNAKEFAKKFPKNQC